MKDKQAVNKIRKGQVESDHQPDGICKRTPEDAHAADKIITLLKKMQSTDDIPVVKI